MATAGITEENLKDAAKKALHGDRAAAVGAIVTVLTGAFTGHPILGVALGSGAEWFVNGVMDRATQRLLEADRAYDDESARVDALAHELADGLAPVWAHAMEELSAQGREQFRLRRQNERPRQRRLDHVRQLVRLGRFRHIPTIDPILLDWGEKR